MHFIVHSLSFLSFEDSCFLWLWVGYSCFNWLKLGVYKISIVTWLTPVKPMLKIMEWLYWKLCKNYSMIIENYAMNNGNYIMNFRNYALHIENYLMNIEKFAMILWYEDRKVCFEIMIWRLEIKLL